DGKIVYPRARHQSTWQAAGFEPDAAPYTGGRDAAGGREGWGMLNQKDGTTYAGQWVSGRRHGVGTLMFEGGIFEGQWARGEATGSGVVRFNNGDRFEGQYVSNRKHGFGAYSWADGAREEGQYRNGEKADWHVWRKGGSMWKLRYDGGVVIEAQQARGKSKDRGTGSYPRAKELARAKLKSRAKAQQPSQKSKRAVEEAFISEFQPQPVPTPAAAQEKPAE
ncbi:unnamed protein product, partial [Effrenium voratum]